MVDRAEIEHAANVRLGRRLAGHVGRLSPPTTSRPTVDNAVNAIASSIVPAAVDVVELMLGDPHVLAMAVLALPKEARDAFRVFLDACEYADAKLPERRDLTAWRVRQQESSPSATDGENV